MKLEKFQRRFDGTYWVVSGPEVRAHPHCTKLGWMYEHEWVLYEKIGPGPHACHWDCGRMLEWHQGQRGIQVDHVDYNVHNNTPENLVPSCVRCNTSRRYTTEELREKLLVAHNRAYSCKWCNKMFKNLSAVRGHSRWCKSKPVDPV